MPVCLSLCPSSRTKRMVKDVEYKHLVVDFILKLQTKKLYFLEEGRRVILRILYIISFEFLGGICFLFELSPVF